MRQERHCRGTFGPVLSIVARDQRALARIEGELHDWYFDLADVVHQPVQRSVVIPFRRWSYEQAQPVGREPAKGPLARLVRPRATEWEAPWFRWLLRVDDVDTFELTDEAAIGTADFNTVTYRPVDRLLTIECSIPVTIRLGVTQLVVRLEETDEILGLARYKTRGNSRLANVYTGEVMLLGH